MHKSKVLPGTVKTVRHFSSLLICFYLDEMGHVHILLDKMGLDEMGLDKMGINLFTPR